MPEGGVTAPARDAVAVAAAGRAGAAAVSGEARDRAPGPAKRRWCATGSGSALAALAPLAEAHAAIGPVALVGTGARIPEDAGVILRLGGPRPDGVYVDVRDGTRALLGWLPDDDCDALATFALAAARVVRRSVAPLRCGPVALLAQWDDRALALADELEPRLGPAALRWTAERVARRDLVDGLGCGVAAALYVGHAMPWGWVGYGGVTAGDLAAAVLEPLGCVLTIACDTAAPWEEARSFSEALPLSSACGAAFGATRKVLHEANRALAHALCTALPKALSLDELLAAVPAEMLDGYVICGDPAAPIASASGARERAEALYAPAPDAPLQIAREWSGRHENRRPGSPGR